MSLARSAAPLAAALVLAAAPSTQAADGAGHVALMKNVTGHVDVVRDAGRVAASAGTPLFVSDRLVSAPGASAGIVFKDGTLLTLGPSTELLVRDVVFEPRDARYAFSVYLARGTAVYASGRIGKIAPDAVKVDSPMATVGVRGTRFVVRVEE